MLCELEHFFRTVGRTAFFSVAELFCVWVVYMVVERIAKQPKYFNVTVGLQYEEEKITSTA